MNRAEILNLAKLAEEANRYDDMAYLMLQVINLSKEMNFEERNLFSMAFKHSIGARRSSHRVVWIMEQKLEDGDPKKSLARDYVQKIEGELRGICNKVLDVLENDLIPIAAEPEAQVFFIKMKADYYRYLAEAITGDERNEIIQKCNDAYEKAFEIAKEKLNEADPIRLGLVLNFSVFYYEIAGATEKACDLADRAFNDALTQLRPVDDEHKDSSMILQLIRDNLTLWIDNEEAEQNREVNALNVEIAPDEGVEECDQEHR